MTVAHRPAVEIVPARRSEDATLDRIALPALLVLAALLRLPNLVTRGIWEADQGHDMLTLRSMVQDGVVPLLGPPASTGGLDHGAWYYYLLSPAAIVTNGDLPLAIVTVIALAGIAAVAVVWWLARQMGGPVAGAVAGLLAAVSAAAIEGSTFIWNPNLIPLSSAVALAGAWRAWNGGHRRWWLLAGLGTAVTMQCHVLGVALLPIVAAPFVVDARRRRLGAVLIGVLAIFVLAYLPLVLHELTTGGSVLRAALEYLGTGRPAADTALPVRFALIGLRVLSWPLTGLITEGLAAGAVASAAVIAIAIWRSRAGGTDQRAARWLGLGLLWSITFLTFAAPSLASVVRGLPNDHYHAFADPLVFTLVGLGAAALARATSGVVSGPRRPIGAAVAVVAVLALVGWNLTHLPPAIHPDGGVPVGEVAAGRVDGVLTTGGVTRGDVIRIQSLPGFKSTEAMVYPLARLGRVYVADTARGLAPGSLDPTGVTSVTDVKALVLLCDDRFRDFLGAACNGPAEATITPDAGGPMWGPLLDRFEAAPDRYVSVYAAASPR